MVKRALLIGVGNYRSDLPQLPAALRDIDAMAQALKEPGIGGFELVNKLSDPGLLSMQKAISDFFGQTCRDDLLLFYFSGHGITDEDGNFFFSTYDTERSNTGQLNKGTAVPARLVHDAMENCDCKRQAIILDCCHSGSFPVGMTARNMDRKVDLSQQLGGKGRIILTSSAATEYSFERDGDTLAIYTQYLIEGITTGSADLDEDGLISVNELHDFVRREVQKASPRMNPERYVFQDGEKIIIAKSVAKYREQLYRKEVEKRVKSIKISPSVRYLLNRKRIELDLSNETALSIEQEILKPFHEYENKLRIYEEMFSEELEFSPTLSNDAWQTLYDVQIDLGLRDEDVEPIHSSLDSLTVKEVEAECLGREEDTTLVQDSSVTSSFQPLPEKLQHALQSMDKDDVLDAEYLQKRILSAQFDFDDFLRQTRLMKHMGSLKEVMKAVPGMGDKLSEEQLQQGEEQLQRCQEMISSMSTEERKNPDLLSNSVERCRRIAEDSGYSENDVIKLVSDFKRMRKLMQQTARGE